MSPVAEFSPEQRIGSNISKLSRKSLCELVSELCAYAGAVSGTSLYHGGIYPANISVGEDGVAIGKAHKSHWKGAELRYIAPELFWHGEAGPAADVYSMGLLLYCGVNDGKLPYEDAHSAAEAQKMRMENSDFPIPDSAGRRLGEIIRKATAFKPGDRYANLNELRAMLDSVSKDLYPDDAEGIFGRNEEELSPVERLMLSIIGREKAAHASIPADAADKPETAEPETDSAEPASPEESEPVEETTEEPTEEPTEEINEQPAGETVEEPDEEPTEEKDEEAPAEDVSEEAPADEPAEKSSDEPAEEPPHEPIPILEVEEHPELEPVVVSTPILNPVAQISKNVERERKIADKVRRRRRRPVIFVLALCILLVISAMIFNRVMRDSEPELPEPVETPNANIEPYVPTVPETIPDTTPEPEPVPELPKESTYQVVIENVSWTEARERCREMGGHLATVSNRAEFDKMVELADSCGLRYVWLGCHRVDDLMVWEDTTEPEEWFWDYGEPSLIDSYDGAAENYLLLWYHNGWYYNDSRDDPEEFGYDSYAGRVGFICEYDN